MLTIELNPDEKVIKIVRRHWIAIIGHIVSFIFIAIIPWVVVGLVTWQFPIAQLEIFGRIFLFIYALWLLLAWNYLFFAWTNYYLDVWIITTLRMFAVDQKELFSRQISSFTFDKIQDLTIDINGVLATFLKFGKITVETAAEKRLLVFKNARDPEMVKKNINDAQNDYQSSY